MTPERWQEVKAALHEVMQLAPERRLVYIQQVSAEDAELRGELESLLASSDNAGKSFLTSPAVEIPENDHKVDPLIGRQLGPYQLVAEIGVGGMGEVYRAVRVDDEFQRDVAIKLVRADQDCAFVVRKFRNERQILASLDHPNIARLLDGGSTEEGMPYFVMELVDGQPIDDYCNTRGLTTTERLKLFAQVCSAVQYAHQRLIIHRDLKPGNILVTPDGVPKLLDFGIAKLLNSSLLTDGPEVTMSIFRILTPKYASPEQVKGEVITTTADVYSLGVVLYELLTGRSPYCAANSTPHEITRAVCEFEPEKPSQAVRSVTPGGANGNAAQAIAAAARALVQDGSPEKLSRQLRGDLDNIVLMALRKEPERRYPSVERFADDLRRHLDHLPITARRDTFGYRVSKFVARHKAGVAAGALTSFFLVAGLVVTLREMRIAERRFEDVHKLADSLIFDIHDAVKDLPGSTPARKLIVERALQYLSTLAEESGNDLALQRELATAYERVGLVQGQYLQNSLGDTSGSLESYQKALLIREQIAAKSRDWNDRLALAQAHRLVGNQQWALGDYPRSLESDDAALAASEALNTARPKDLSILKELGLEYALAGSIRTNTYAGGGGDPQKVEENYHKAVAVDEAMLVISPGDLAVQHAYATDLNHLGGALRGHDDFDAALECYRKELEIEQDLRQRSAETRYARGVALAYSHLGQTYDRLGDSALSLENYTRGLEISQQLTLADPKNTWFQQGLAIAYTNTAGELTKMGRYNQGFGYLEKSDQIMRALVAAAPENKEQRGTFAALIVANGTTLMNLGKLDAAMKDFNEARTTFESLQTKGWPIGYLSCTEKMGETASRAGDSKLAAAYFQQVLKAVKPELAKPDAAPNVFYLAADSYSGLGDLDLRSARQSRGDIAKQRENWANARAWYLTSLAAWHRIEHPRREAPGGYSAGDPAQVARNLHLCEASLASAKKTKTKSSAH